MEKTTVRYEFHCKACGQSPLHVLRLQGTERLGRPYEFSLMLAGPVVRPDDLLDAEAALCLRVNDQILQYCGFLSAVEELGRVHDLHRYQVTLSPELAKLGFAATNALYVDTTVPEIIRRMLQESALFEHLDCEQKLSGAYPKRALVSRYQENDQQFLHRLLERSGMYYYFEQGISEQTPDRVVFADAPVAHKAPGREQTFVYREADGLAEDGRHNAIRAFSSTLGLTPGQVEVNDYNPEHPGLSVAASAPVRAQAASDAGKERFIGGADTQKQAQDQATVRAQSLACHARCFSGALDVPRVRSGMLIKLEEHPQDTLNAEYLVTGVRHEGTQPLPDGGVKTASGTYQAKFSAIPANQPFKLLWQTPKPLVSGVLTGRIEAEGSGQYAELDADGYYKLQLPFGTEAASSPVKAKVRMLQPYGGKEGGMHFPLHKGCEVLVAFLQGDPDRPVIVGAVPNVSAPSVVTASTPGAHSIQTNAGHVLTLDDSSTNNRLSLSAAGSKTAVHIGDNKHPNKIPEAFTSVVHDLGDALDQLKTGMGS